MRELAPRYDGFILDLWGVVHDGVAPFPGVLDCMARLVDAGKRIVLLSNAPRRADDVVGRIEKIGVPRPLYHAVMSSGEEAWQHLDKRDEPFYAALGRRCLHICSERDLEMREGLDLDWVDTPEAADFILNTGPAEWEDTHEDYAAVLEAARRRDLPMVCANPDLVVLHAGRAALCAGAIAEQYEAMGGRVRWHGKPHRSVYDSVLGLLGVADRGRILAIGDSLRTDIAGAGRGRHPEPVHRRPRHSRRRIHGERQARPRPHRSRHRRGRRQPDRRRRRVCVVMLRTDIAVAFGLIRHQRNPPVPDHFDAREHVLRVRPGEPDRNGALLQAFDPVGGVKRFHRLGDLAASARSSGFSLALVGLHEARRRAAKRDDEMRLDALLDQRLSGFVDDA